jgi:hypothetical protein
MPDLKQLLRIKSKYDNSNTIAEGAELNKLFEGFDIKKGFDSTFLGTRRYSYTVDIANSYIEYFEKRLKANVVLLFIDITSFSSRFTRGTPNDIATFLDDYYNTVLPIITKYGGVVEKIMGDGIICIFGAPFLEESSFNLHRKAEQCSQEIIMGLKNTDKEVKIALHFGEIMYYHNNTSDYLEYTMIGRALTELFRLECVSYNNSINFYCPSDYNSMKENDVKNSYYHILRGQHTDWNLMSMESINTNTLKGISYSSIRRLQKT